jgi:hypothetical protein
LSKKASDEEIPKTNKLITNRIFKINFIYDTTFNP